MKKNYKNVGGVPVEILDTQIISFVNKGKNVHPIVGKAISAVTASEFLTLQRILAPGSKCFLPLPRWYLGLEAGPFRRDHPFNKKSTDSLVINFGKGRPPVVYDGCLALSHIINGKNTLVFEESIKFGVSKPEKRSIMKRLDFLLENELVCLPLSPRIVDITMSLIERFESQFNLKQDLRNSCNDLLILSTAVESFARLVTHDSVLKRFAAAQYQGRIQAKEEKITIEFPSKIEGARKPGRESKGYINRGWQFAFRNYRNASK